MRSVQPAADYNCTMSTGSPENLVGRIDALLPQTQCTRCGYAACRPYAEAIARGAAAINRCPPGGMDGVRALAQLTGQPVVPLDPTCGEELPPRVAVIDEAVCIGCTKCIQACPVDAIVGASKLMHTVIADLCTGCELCVPPCPVDCIAMLPVPAIPRQAQPDAAREHFLARNARLTREREARASRSRGKLDIATQPVQTISHADVLAAIARGRAKIRAVVPARRATNSPATPDDKNS
jgi:electron transport complex protein RnfB